MKAWIYVGLVAMLVFVLVPVSVSATSRTYMDATIELKATGFQNYGINGTHSSREGFGHDDSITLWGRYFHCYPVYTIYQNSKQFDQPSGLNTKVVLTGFDGLMQGQLHSIFGRYPIRMIGHADLITITVYRG